MKKIVLKEKVSEISIDDVQINSIVLVKKQGKEFGVITNNGGMWTCKSIKDQKDWYHLSDACKWFGSKTEFYVLD